MKINKFPHAATIVGVVVLVLTLIGQRVFLKKSFPDQPLKIVLEKNISLESIVANDDAVVAKLKKGDTVRFLGVVEGSHYYPYGLLVQTQDGERGLLPAADMGFPMMMTNKKDSLPVTVKSLFREKTKVKGSKGTLKYNIVKANGEKDAVNVAAVRPILPDSLSDMQLRREGDYYMTKEKFQRLYMGHKLAENDARYRQAWVIDKTKKGFLAYYPNIELVDTDDGKIYNPIVVYDADSVAVTCGYEAGHGNNRYILKWMPFLGKIVDTDFFAHFIEGSIYGSWTNADTENYTEKAKMTWKEVPFYMWIALILWVVCGLAWMFLMETLPLLILEAGLYCRYLYFHLNDGMIASIFGVVAAVAIYLWLALMAVWGCLWLFLPIIVIAGISAWAYAERMLGTHPHTRCPDCRRMETIEFVNRTFDREYNEWRHDSQAIDSHTERWKTWTDVTTKWSDGRTTHSTENERNHSRTTTLYNDYDVYYHVKVYHKNYKCAGCGHSEYVPEEELTELDRKFTGRHTTVTET